MLQGRRDRDHWRAVTTADTIKRTQDIGTGGGMIG
jgi:hypothetical protein